MPSGDYVAAILSKQRAETLSSVLYPDDRTYEGKELRLKQQHFFVSATIQVGVCGCGWVGGWGGEPQAGWGRLAATVVVVLMRGLGPVGRPSWGSPSGLLSTSLTGIGWGHHYTPACSHISGRWRHGPR